LSLFKHQTRNVLFVCFTWLSISMVATPLPVPIKWTIHQWTMAMSISPIPQIPQFSTRSFDAGTGTHQIPCSFLPRPPPILFSTTYTHTHTWGKINKKKKENLGFIGRILTYSLGALIINVLGFFFASYK